MIFERYF